MTNWFAIALVLLLFSCTEKQVQVKSNSEEMPLNELLILENKKRIEMELDQIDAYVKRNDWEVKITDTGLRFFIYNDVEGILIKPGDRVSLKYKVSLLNGQLCYQTNDSNELFRVEKDQVESGLHEGIQLLNKGDKAKFVLPSYLAHGLMGDQKKIPAKASIVYDLEVINVNNDE